MKNFNIQQQLRKQDSFFNESESATIIINNQKEKEKEKEKETFEGSLQEPDLTSSSPSNDRFSSFSSWQASPANKNEYVRGLTDRCAGQRILNDSGERRPAHLLHALKKSDILAQVQQEDVKYCRISVYRFVDDLAQNTQETWRVNMSLKFYDEQQYFDLLDENGFCKLMVKCSPRIRDLKRVTEPGYADWPGYQQVRDFAMQHPVKLAGKGAFLGKKGSRITPPCAYYTAMAIVDDKPLGTGIFEPFAFVRVGDFTQEIELYPSDDNQFGYHGEFKV